MDCSGEESAKPATSPRPMVEATLMDEMVDDDDDDILSLSIKSDKESSATKFGDDTKFAQ